MCLRSVMSTSCVAWGAEPFAYPSQHAESRIRPVFTVCNLASPCIHCLHNSACQCRWARRTLRFFGHSDGNGYPGHLYTAFPIQTSLGVFSEQALQRYDFVLAQCAQVRVLGKGQGSGVEGLGTNPHRSGAYVPMNLEPHLSSHPGMSLLRSLWLRQNDSTEYCLYAS